MPGIGAMEVSVARFGTEGGESIEEFSEKFFNKKNPHFAVCLEF